MAPIKLEAERQTQAYKLNGKQEFRLSAGFFPAIEARIFFGTTPLPLAATHAAVSRHLM
jgi:hypothetical protein